PLHTENTPQDPPIWRSKPTHIGCRFKATSFRCAFPRRGCFSRQGCFFRHNTCFIICSVNIAITAEEEGSC
ncbi:hypothetical protein PGIGA_G00019860, partial [Pangasianodon gigas]|nr:hypothetical protein [Pangasianodon gigas]